LLVSLVYHMASMNRLSQLYYHSLGQLLSFRRLVSFAVGCLVILVVHHLFDASHERQSVDSPTYQHFFQDFRGTLGKAGDHLGKMLIGGDDESRSCTECGAPVINGQYTDRMRTQRLSSTRGNRKTRSMTAGKEVHPKRNPAPLKKMVRKSSVKKQSKAPLKKAIYPKPTNMTATLCPSLRPCGTESVSCCHCEIHEGCPNLEHIRFCINSALKAPKETPL